MITTYYMPTRIVAGPASLAMIGTLVFLPEGLFGARVRRRTV